MAIKRFETQDGIIIRPDDDIVNQNDQSLLGGNGETAAITLTGKIPYVVPVFDEPPVVFTRPNNSPNTIDAIDTGVALKRANNGALYNSANNVETSYNQNTSPLGTEWNADGWGDLADVKTRTYTNFTDTVQLNTWLAAGIHHKELVMHDTINDKYYTFKFFWWQANGGSGSGDGVDQKSGFSYARQLIITDPSVVFVHPAGDANVNQDDVGSNLSITRGTNGGGIYNASEEGAWDADVSPYGTLWNDEGWDDFEDITTRTWRPFFAAVHGRLGNEIVGRKLLMKDTGNNKYYVVMFTEWGSDNGGSFAYWRREVSATGTKLGITFADGTIQTSALDLGNIRIDNNAITAGLNSDITIQTNSDPLINADIIIDSSDDVYIIAKGGEGVDIFVDNSFYVEVGDSQFKTYNYNGMTWEASTIVITQWNSDILRSLDLYTNNTWDIDFRLDTGEWKGIAGTNVYSVGNAVYDSGLGRWTIPINIDNTGDPIVITNIRLRDPDYTYSHSWKFDRNGALIADWNTHTRVTQSNLSGNSSVIWTSVRNAISSVKLTIQVEATETGDNTGWHSQVCEAIVASRGYANDGNGVGEPVMTVYGVTHTSTLPMITYTVQRNATTKNIEIVATKTAANSGSWGTQFRIYSVEMVTRD